MIRSFSCLVLAVAFQVIFGQAEQSGLRSSPPSHEFQRQSMAVPKHCMSPPPGVDFLKCCPILPIFSEEDLERCGIDKPSTGQPKPPPKPKGSCHESKCLMQNANLLLANQSVDYEKLGAFVDKWANMNPNFTEAITGAKRVCAYYRGPAGPSVCEQDRVFICLSSMVLWNCKLQDLDGTSGCRILKEHIDECKPYSYTQSEEEELLSRKL